MNLNNISLPYPVLGISDDVFPLLSDDCMVVTQEQTLHEFCFHIKLKQENQDIRLQIANGYAEYVCEVDCPRTRFRECYTSSQPTISIKLNKNAVCRDIIFTCMVVVKKAIPHYTSKNFNPDYQGCSFDMQPGDILVFFGSFTYNADIQYDKLQAAGAFMQIREGIEKEYTCFNLADDYIEILLPSPLYNTYKNELCHNNQFIEIIHSSLVFNALVYAINNIEENRNTLWAQTLEYRLHEEPDLKEYDIEDKNCIPELAQALLGDPYKRLFNSLQKMEQINNEEE